mgnify:CR=1 FL=1
MEANQYEPARPSPVMRIFSALKQLNRPYRILINEFVRQFKYTFDNVTPYNYAEVTRDEAYRDMKVIDDQKGLQITQDFQQARKNGVETVIILCDSGAERNPAVALALNELFRLGSTPAISWKCFPITTTPSTRLS